MLEGPGVEPSQAFVESDLVVTHDERIGAEQRARAPQHRLHRVTCFIAFGVRPQRGRHAPGTGVAAAEHDNQPQQLEQALRRLARKLYRHSVAFDG